MSSKHCRNCEKGLTSQRYYCSKDCKKIYNTKDFSCEYCGKVFSKYVDRQCKPFRFCGNSCSAKYKHEKEMIKRPADFGERIRKGLPKKS